MPRLLNGRLVTRHSLAVLQILLNSTEIHPFRPELPGHDERQGKVHLHVGDSRLVSEQEFAAALLELAVEVPQIVLDVLGQPNFGFLDTAGLLVPASVQDGDTVEGESSLGCVDPLQDLVAFWVSYWRKQTMRLVVLVAEVSIEIMSVNRKDEGLSTQHTRRCCHSL